MKYQNTILAIALILFSTPAWSDIFQGDPLLMTADSSGGGVAVVCDQQPSGRSAEMLDIFEGRTIYGLQISPLGKDLEGNLSGVKGKLDIAFSELGLTTTPSLNLDKAQLDLEFLPKNADALPLKNSYQMILPQNCQLQQAAVYENDSKLVVSASLWELMDELNRAALITHQAIYLHERQLGDKNAQRTRKIVAHLFSNKRIESIKTGIPADANECVAYNKYDKKDVAFKFYKFVNPQNELQDVLQFTEFRNLIPYTVTRAYTPKWSWPKSDGDLVLEVISELESFDQLYLRRSWSPSGDLLGYYLDEVSADYEIQCAKSTETDLAFLKIAGIPPFESIAVGGTRTMSYQIINSGKGTALHLSGLGLKEPFSFVGGAYPGTGGTCTGKLVPGAMCTVFVQFSPKSAGNYKDAFFVKYNDGTTPQEFGIEVDGLGVSPAVLQISNGPLYNFGTAPAGSSREQMFRVNNSGGAIATDIKEIPLAAPFKYKGGSYPGTNGTCGKFIEAGTSCNLYVVFEPDGIGSYSGTLELSYVSGSVTSTTARALQGAAVAPGLLTILQSEPYDFGTLATGSVINQTFTLKNTGGFAISTISGAGLAAPFSFAGGYFPGTGGSCFSFLAVGASCTVVLRFAPVALGVSNDSLDIQYFDGAKTQTTARAVIGVGASPALVVVSDGPTYNFGFVYPGNSISKTFTLTNTGTIAATKIASADLSFPFSYSGSTYPGTNGTCGQTLAAGASCTVVLEFNPDQIGAYEAQMSFQYDNGVKNAESVRPLNGKSGQPAELVMTAGTAIYDFGITPVGTEKFVEIYVVNTGGSAASKLGLTGSFTQPFFFVGGAFPGTGGTCGAVLEASDSCVLLVRFAPTATGEYAESLALAYNNGDTQQVVVQYFQGKATAPIVSPDPVSQKVSQQ